MSWFTKLIPSRIRTSSENRRSIPEGVWEKCPSCSAVLFKAELERNFLVCPKCDHHLRVSARKRLSWFLDPGATEIAAEIEPQDVLKFKDTKRYKDRLQAAQKATGEKDALVAMFGTLYAAPIVAAAFEFDFIGGSMGTVVGNRFVQAVEMAIQRKCPFVVFATSGGARMQEALFSLMQMGKTAAALGRLKKAGLPYISVMVDPCMGGVSASLAMLGDLHISEPRALIGFAGPRVIEQIVREKLPEGFQRSEFLLEHGFLDCIIDRRHMRFKIAGLLAKFLHMPPIEEGG